MAYNLRSSVGARIFVMGNRPDEATCHRRAFAAFCCHFCAITCYIHVMVVLLYIFFYLFAFARRLSSSFLPIFYHHTFAAALPLCCRTAGRESSSVVVAGNVLLLGQNRRALLLKSSTNVIMWSTVVRRGLPGSRWGRAYILGGATSKICIIPVGAQIRYRWGRK